MDERHYFDFFDLPPEMRDAIYELLLVDRLEIKQRRKGLAELPVTVTLRNSPYPHLLLVNKQFSHEYRQRIHPFTVLEFEDNGKTIDTSVFVPPLIPVEAFFKLLILDTYTHIDQMQMHRTWITSMLTAMKRPATLSINVHDAFIEAIRPTSVKLYSYVESFDVDMSLVQTAVKLRQTWTVEGGWRTE
ncbi:hypothetical protein LTR17_010524 [Elasticomyces elasticus]|nr:hypothetical protein LTR17_010524 [Elasticomyces elasticus]